MKFSETWCSWTTFGRLAASDAGYWTAGLPNSANIGDTYIGDGGVWGQPFHFSDLAHLIVPGKFVTDDGVVKTQDIQRLSARLGALGVPHKLAAALAELP